MRWTLHVACAHQKQNSRRALCFLLLPSFEFFTRSVGLYLPALPFAWRFTSFDQACLLPSLGYRCPLVPSAWLSALAQQEAKRKQQQQQAALAGGGVGGVTGERSKARTGRREEAREARIPRPHCLSAALRSSYCVRRRCTGLCLPACTRVRAVSPSANGGKPAALTESGSQVPRSFLLWSHGYSQLARPIRGL